ncbi:hypothetical protein ABS71_11020 [bacterium SCN 62-11]|nr:hypothetical protein [Candidatus Eremiobacteraeota bacterium]ODT67334.1 MAG: hypothetical protein ABS71_11020 [bacterium SCN 62-11]
MDAVMKILKEIERQNQAPRNDSPAPQQQKRKKRREAAEQQQQESMAQAQQESAQSDDWQQPVAQARPAWDRQRIADALQLMMVLGPPPGLQD